MCCKWGCLLIRLYLRLDLLFFLIQTLSNDIYFKEFRYVCIFDKTVPLYFTTSLPGVLS